MVQNDNWSKWQNYVLNELKRLNDSLESIVQNFEKRLCNADKEREALRLEMTVYRTKFGIMVIGASIVFSSIIAPILSNLIDKFI